MQLINTLAVAKVKDRSGPLAKEAAEALEWIQNDPVETRYEDHWTALEKAVSKMVLEQNLDYIGDDVCTKDSSLLWLRTLDVGEYGQGNDKYDHARGRDNPRFSGRAQSKEYH